VFARVAFARIVMSGKLKGSMLLVGSFPEGSTIVAVASTAVI